MPYPSFKFVVALPPAIAMAAAVAVVAATGGLITGCTTKSPSLDTTVKEILDSKPVTTSDGGSTAGNLDEYKRELSQRISQVNSTKVYVTRPQALLRSVIVIHFWVDAQGGLTRSEIVRTNRDKAAETTALASLRGTAPFPKPPKALLAGGKVEISETWLFNNDGRFQLRSVAQPQMDR